MKRLESRSLYTVGWIAALSIELTAAIQMLDERHERPKDFTQGPTDSNSYVWGNIGSHNIVLSVLEAGGYGTTPAATTATNLLASFPNVRIGLLVGIGAGIRRGNFDIRLGDVVISQPDGKSGGVYQYDLLKARTENSSEAIGILNRPSTVLLKVLALVKAHHNSSPSKVPEYLKRTTKDMREPQNKKPGYVYQGVENDRLFKSSFSHISGPCDTGSEISSDDDFDRDDPDPEQPSLTCPYCPSTQEVKRQERASAANPQFHYGTIASGNTLIKDAEERNKIAKRVGKNCICFEMEAAGLMNNFPCLVIRGICDYADSHKNDRWQPYAALTAAAYAREFLEFVPRGDVEREQPLVEQLQNMGDIQTTAANINTTVQAAGLKDWLSPPDPSINYNIAMKERSNGAIGTGNWFLESQEFHQWKETKSSFLWLHGSPGCGKTILCSTAIEYLMSEETEGNLDFVVLYYYFAFSDAYTLSYGSLLRSLIAQLALKTEQAMRQLTEFYTTKSKSSSSQPSEDELAKVLSSMIGSFSHVMIVLDGLDEVQEAGGKRDEILQWIKVTSHAGSDIRILVSSRSQHDIRSEFTQPKFERHPLEVELLPEKVDGDVQAYVHQQVYEGPFLQRWRAKPEMQSEIERKLIKNANGMFRWVVCQMDAIKHCLDPEELRRQLGSLPDTLNKTYERIIQDLPRVRQPKAIKLLQFLAFAKRPLGLFEAVDVVAVDVAKSPCFDPKNRMPDPHEIVKLCSSLVKLDSQDPKHLRLQLAHFSVKEYLISTHDGSPLEGHFSTESAHSSITNICLGYLTSGLPSIMSIRGSIVPDMNTSVDSPFVDAEATWKYDLSRFPLMEYAIYRWPEHARLCYETVETTSNNIKRFFKNESAVTKWLFCFTANQPAQVCEDERMKISCPLLLSIYLDLDDMALSMIANDVRFETEAISERMLPYLDFDDWGEGSMAHNDGCAMTSHLYMAAEKGMCDVVRALINKGVDIHEEGGGWGTPINGACAGGCEEIITVLLQHSRDSDSQERHDLYAKEALDMVFECGDIWGYAHFVSIRNQILNYCSNRGILGSPLDFSLKTAFIDEDLNLARELVLKGARVDEVANSLRYSFSDDEEFLLSFLQLFSEEGSGNVDPNALQKLFAAEGIWDCDSLVAQAVKCRFNKLLNYLIANGADRQRTVTSTYDSSSKSCTILYRAVEKENTEAVQMLLNVNATTCCEDSVGSYIPPLDYINKRDGCFGRTCLHLAAECGFTDIMKALLSCGADVEVKDDFSKTPLHYACEQNQLGAVQLLMEYGSDPEARDQLNDTPLDKAFDTVGDGFWEPSKAVIEWFEQQKNEAYGDSSPCAERDLKRKRESDDGGISCVDHDLKYQRTE